MRMTHLSSWRCGWAIGIGGKVGGVEFGWSRGLGNVTL